MTKPKNPLRCETCENTACEFHKYRGQSQTVSKYPDEFVASPSVITAWSGCISYIGAGHSRQERYTGPCAMQDQCTDYADLIESMMDEIDNDDGIPCSIKCAKRVNPNQADCDEAARDARDAAFVELEPALQELIYGNHNIKDFADAFAKAKFKGIKPDVVDRK